MIRARNLDKGEVIFTHWDKETGKCTHFAISRLAKAINALLSSDEPDDDLKHLQLCIIPIDPEYVEHIKQNMGIEPHRLGRITREMLEHTILMIADLGDGTQAIIDGCHRYSKAHEFGMKEIAAVLVKEPLWRKFTIKGEPFPEYSTEEDMAALSSGFSGLA